MIPQAKHGRIRLDYDASLGCDIKDALMDAWIISMRSDLPVRCAFNGVEIIVTQHLTPTDAYLLWNAKMRAGDEKKP